MAILDHIERIQLPSAPDIPGLVFRRFRGEADYPHILACINGSKGADGIERGDTLEDVANNYAHLNNCDPYQDMVFIEVRGDVVGYSRVWWDKELEGAWIGFSLCFLLPEWRRKGVGVAILRHNEARLKEIACQQVRNSLLGPTTRCLYDHFVFDTEIGKEALLVREGYQPVRYAFNMVRPNLFDIPAAPMPPGLEVRPVQPEHFRAIWEASQEAFRDHWGYIPEGEEAFQRFINDPIQDPALWRVAWDGDQVAGMVLTFINTAENEDYKRKRGWTENICVRRPWRRRGLARSLIIQSLHALKELGMEEAALGVDAQNLSGALHLYESCGFQVVKRSTIYRKPFEIYDC